MNWKLLRRRLAWTAFGAVVLIALAWLLVPPLVKAQIEQRGSVQLGREFRVDKVTFSPWALSVTVQGLSVAGAEGDPDPTPQFSAERLHVDASVRSLFERAPVIEAFELDAPRLRLARLASQRYDVDDVLDRLRAPAAPAAAPADAPSRFAVFNVQVRGGALRFDDQPVQQRHELQGVTVALPFVSNLPADLAVKVEPHIAAVLDGSPFELRGETLPFAADRASELRLVFSALDLSRWWGYLPGNWPVRPSGGVLAADLALRFAQPPGSAARLALSGSLGLDGPSLQARNGDPLASWRRLAVTLADVRPFERQVALESVVLDGLQLDLRRDAAGRLDWAALAAGNGAATPAATSPATPAVAAASAASAPAGSAGDSPWRLSLATLTVTDAGLRWRDASTRPAFALDAVQVSLQAESLAWPGDAGTPLQAAALLQQGNADVARLALKGTMSANRASLVVDVTDARLAAAAPYLQQWLRPRLEGRLNATASIDWATGDMPRQLVSMPSLRLDALNLAEAGSGQRSGPSALPQRVAAIELDDTRVDLLARQVIIGALRLRDPAVHLHRPAGGDWNASGWMVAPPDPPGAAARASAPSASTAPPWRAELKDLRLSGGRVQVDDAAAGGAGRRPVALSLSALQVGARGLNWPPTATPAAFEVSAQWPESGAPAGATPAGAAASTALQGRVQARGKLTLAPVGVLAAVDLQRLPVHALEPYFAARLPVLLRRAELGFKGDVDLQLVADGPRLALRGDGLLADLRVQARAAGAGDEEGGDELLSWQSLTLRPLSVALQPGRKPAIEVGELVLSDFFSRLIITEQGRFNLRDVRGAPSDGATPTPAAVATASADPAAAPTAVAEPLPATAERPGPAFDLVVGSTRLASGRVDFSDRFIRPNYSAQLTELNGSLGRFSTASREMATVDLRGRAAGTAMLEVRGAVNPTADPLALDISARVSDLELAPFSPYAGKYAGYAIERGKLSLDIAYRIDPDGRLQARNQLVLNQLTFGDRIEGPDVTKLPVRLAVALLTDNNGVIDLDLPISGSINDPQFSVFGLVLKVIGNLIVKALTSPFSLLAGGGGEDLSVVEFVPGTARIAEAGVPVVERVAKSLADRPALRMTVTGAADPASEREAMQSAALEARLQTEQRRERARAGASGEAAVGVALAPLTAEQRERLIKRIYSETQLPNKPRNLVGLAKDLPAAEMEALLRQATPVSSDTARELALQRGLAVRDALVDKGLPAERLFLAAPKLQAQGDETKPWTPRVQLSLSTR